MCGEGLCVTMGNLCNRGYTNINLNRIQIQENHFADCVPDGTNGDIYPLHILRILSPLNSQRMRIMCPDCKGY